MSTKFSHRPVSEQSHEEHVAAGRKGGLARQHSNENDDHMEASPAKRPRSLSSHNSNNNKNQSGSKKSGQTTNSQNGSSRRGDDYDPESDKYGNEDFNDGIAMHTRSHDGGDDDHHEDDHEDEDSSQTNTSSNNRKSGGNSTGVQKSGAGVRSSTGNTSSKSDSKSQAHTDFQSGKNPNRQAVSKALAQSRGHEAFVEMGRKGGKGNAGIHADMDYDDMESFKDHPEEGVPAKNPNRVRGGKQAAETRGHEEMSEMGKQGGRSNAGVPKLGGNVDMGEDDSESFNQKDAKNPNRVQGGLRGAAKQSHESFVERGKKGGSSNAQKNGGNNRNNKNNNNNNSEDDEDDNNDEEDDNNDYDGQNDEGKNPNRVEGGKKAAETRARNGTQSHSGSRPQSQSGNNNSNNNNNRGRQSGGQSQSQSKSNNNNKSRQQQQDDDNEEDEDQDMDDDNEDNNEGKNPNRVEGGKKAAETRARNGTQSHSGSRPHSQSGNNNNNNNRGGNNTGRGGNNRSNSNNNNSHNDDNDDDEDNFDDYPTDDFEAGEDAGGKNPNRVAGGKKAASHFSHEELSERAQRAAQTRAQNGTQSHSGSRPKNEKYNDNMDLEDQDDDGNNENEDNEEDEQNEEGGDEGEGKNPNRVEGGKKAAQTRAERGTQSHSGSRGGNDKNGGNYRSQQNNNNNNSSNNNNNNNRNSGNNKQGQKKSNSAY